MLSLNSSEDVETGAAELCMPVQLERMLIMQ